jgi:hypothetical protein
MKQLLWLNAWAGRHISMGLGVAQANCHSRQVTLFGIIGETPLDEKSLCPSLQPSVSVRV